VSDFDSVNNFAKDDTNLKDGSNLEQARKAIEEANEALKRAVGLLVVDWWVVIWQYSSETELSGVDAGVEWVIVD
jgi:hypothetical protein